ncbi:maleylpyruvate isomerase family mycothiol-dependent enzyme [Nocardioides solisilvae]|uniref:maleylpyruvate isomerase family mycothiol-dependent enzyme n=1 Tax=Nocardioides solisilvae TaxID=1542435 RepID=UPI0013A549B8|nr:maleylpyruvate isomerase family mycothiol-dependent enzyme [Nocardioides solisilvae]
MSLTTHPDGLGATLRRTLRPMPSDEVWRHVHAERRAMGAMLASLSEEEWERPSLCAGWTVRDVAAHVIATPQIHAPELVALLARNLGRSYDAMIFRDVKRRGRQPVATILADFERYAGSRHRVAVTTSVEPLLDVLVHHQDVVRALGRHHDPDVGAALVAADRCRLLPGLLHSRSIVRQVRMVATDVDWVRGDGPELRGRASELLMVCAGRGRAATGLSGEGVALLAA